MARLRFRILGCGSSGGVPRLADKPGGEWGACDPANPKNRRQRCSLLVERTTDEGTTRVLIDTTPDLSQQLVAAGVGTLDAVVYTHAHADHTHGIDDLRMVAMNLGHVLPVWADAATSSSLLDRFAYIFVQPVGSSYPPICRLYGIEETPFEITGAGGPIQILPFPVDHGGIPTLGFRIGGLAYTPDLVRMTPKAWEAVEGLEVWVVDALRYRPHPTHAHLDLTLEWIAKAQPQRAVLTNMHIDLDYATLAASLPQGVAPAYDGLTLELED